MPGDNPTVPVLNPGGDLLRPGLAVPPADAAAAKLYQDTLPTVVQIGTNRGSGTGFFVDKEGTIVTAAHVVLNTKEHFAITPDGTKYRLQIEKMDDINDLAVMRPIGLPKDNPFLKLAPDSKLKPLQPLYALGHPEGRRPAYISPGVYKAPSTTLELLAQITPRGIRELGDKLHEYTPKELYDLKDSLDRQLVHSELQIRHGNSGGPLVDAAKNVVGVSDMINPANPTQSYYVPVEKIHELLKPDNNKFAFTYSRMPEEWTQTYLANWYSRPALASFQTGMAGACGYLGNKAMRWAPVPIAAGLGAYSAGTLLSDMSDLLGATDRADQWKYGLASLADATAAAGALAMLHPKSRPFGMAAVGLGLTGRAGTDFMRNRLILTDISRPNGDTRSPYDMDI